MPTPRKNGAKIISIGVHAKAAGAHATATQRKSKSASGEVDLARTAPSLTDEALAIDRIVERRVPPLVTEAAATGTAATGTAQATPRDVRDTRDTQRSRKRGARLPDEPPAPPRPRLVLTGYYISRDTIYGPERSGEFYMRGQRIYISRRALAASPRIPGAAVRELGRTLGDLAGLPRAHGTVANRVAGRDTPPIPTGYFTINGYIYGGVGRAHDAATRGRSADAQLAKGEFRIQGNLIYGPAGRRVPWLAALVPVAKPTVARKHAKKPARSTRPKAA
jgi:hypothetical protein